MSDTVKMVYEGETSTETIERLFMDFETPKRFSPKQLEELTTGFSKSLGSGAFGKVFKGVLHDGVQVAVKVLKEELLSNVRKDQFKAEVSVLGKTHHKNVVKLYGFCFERNMNALVYEFMEHESLEKQLYINQSIAWETLCNIAAGTAKGLSYLHEDCQPRILHYDIKPSNILLDSKFSPKVGDFGLAKLLSQDTTHITESRFRGTPRYAAPELWTPYSSVTGKCDVYSFGVTLFDIVGRRRSHPLAKEQFWFPFRVWIKFQKEKQEEIMAECGIQKNNREQAKRILLIALRCVQFDPRDRPSMSQVVRFLEGTEEVQLPNGFYHMDSSNEEKEEDEVSRMMLGPWGGTGGSEWDDGIFVGIKKIQVFKGVKGDVRAIQVWYCGEDGESISSTRHGYSTYKEAHTTDTFELAYPSEYLMRVTGFYGFEFGNEGFLLVRSLCFFTNKKIYGPFGDERGIYFTSKYNGKDGKVVGFHGRDGWYLDAIGMHMDYNNDHLEIIKENDEPNVARIRPTTIGPFGGTGGGNWDDGVSPGIKKIEIYKGIKGDIRSMQIWYCGKDEDPIWSERHGYVDTHTTDTIELDYPSEYLVRVTGFCGYEFVDGGFYLVRSLCFFTNKNKYGPFGDENGSYFEKDGKDGKVIGFHGKSRWYLDAIGMHMDYS